MGDHTYTNANQAQTDLANASVGNASNLAAGNMGQLQGQVTQAANQGINAAQNYNPNAGMNSFLQYAPTLQNMVMGAQSPLQQGLNAQAMQESAQAMRNTGNQFSNTGSLHSGAAQAAIAQAGAQPFANVQNQLGSQLVNQTGALWGQAMPAMMSANQYGAGLQQNALGNALGAYGSMYGQNTGLYGQAMGAQAQLGAPDQTQNPNWWDYTMQGIGAATSVASAIAGVPSKK